MSDKTRLAIVSLFFFFLYVPLAHASVAYFWTDQTSAGSRNWYGITSSADGTQLAAIVESGDIYTSTTSGATWTDQTTAGSRNWNAITSSSDGTHLAAVVNGGDIYTSTTSGATWTDQTTAGSRNWYSITSSSDGTHLAATLFASGDIYTSTTSGATWTDQTAAGSRNWYGITSSSDGTHLAAIVVSGGDIYTSTTSGATWTDQTTAGSRNWYGITSSSDGTHLAAVVNGGDIYTSTTSGATWTDQTTAGSRNWIRITSSSDGTHLAAVTNGGDIYTSTDGGVTWADQVAAGSRSWSRITSSSDGTHLAAVVFGGDIYTNYVDTIPPIVAMTSPVASSTISGSSVTFTASSTDAIAVTGVTFYVNGAPISSQITSGTTQFSTSWDSTATQNGSIVVTAVSEDAAGNYATSTPVSFIVGNPPISSIAASASQSGVTITWTTPNDPSTSQVVYGLSVPYTGISVLNSATTTSHSVSLSNLSPGTTYNYEVISTDSIGNTATSSNQAFTTLFAGNSGGSGGGGGGGGGGGSTSVTSASTGAATVSGTPTTVPSGATGVSGYVFTNSLGLGSTGSEVTHLQSLLIADGYLAVATPTGYFGSLTSAAVMKYQSAKGIKNTGYVGPLTLSSLNTETQSAPVPATTVSPASAAHIAALKAELLTLEAELLKILDASAATATTTSTTTSQI